MSPRDFLIRASLAQKFSLMLVALVIPMIGVGVILAQGLETNAQSVLAAHRVKELATRAVALRLLQDDVTKEILLDVERITEAERKIEAYDESLLVLDRLDELTDSPAILAALAELRRIDEDELRPLDSIVLETLSSDGLEAARDTYFDRYEPVRARYQETARGLQDLAEARAHEAELEFATNNRDSLRKLVVALATGTALVAGILWAIASSLRTRIRRVVDALEEVARGDLSGRLAVDSEDEIGRITFALDRAVSEMCDAMLQTRASARDLEVGVLQIAHASDAVASSAADQNREVERASESMDDVTNQVWALAESARNLRTMVDESGKTVWSITSMSDRYGQASDVLMGRVDQAATSIARMSQSIDEVRRRADALFDTSESTARALDEMSTSIESVSRIVTESSGRWEQMVERGESGGALFRETVVDIQTVHEASLLAEQAVAGLGSRAHEIGAVVDVIKDVADETNLLALNASIIAAQAGVNGRSFAVVAGEIRKLASRVTRHASSIEELIRSVQGEVAGANEAMHQGAQRVARTVERSTAAGAAVDELTRSSRESADQIAEIAAAIVQQTAAVRGIVESMSATREAVGVIREAAATQGESNAAVRASIDVVAETAREIASTTEEQAQSAANMAVNVEGVREAAAEVERALQEQTAATQRLCEFLERVGRRCGENTRSATLTSAATEELRELARLLRERVGRFSLESADTGSDGR